jgi:hypothetical protein
MANSNLTDAKRAKNDEFYTQYADIQKEIEAYVEYDPNVFRGKVVYCNCDDPYESNFFRYFVLNFNKLGLKRLITTSYVPSPIAGTMFPLGEAAGLKEHKIKQPFKIEIYEVKDEDGDGAVNLTDVKILLKHDKNVMTRLTGNGDFRSDECVELLKQSDIVVTNPPFSLFREYVKQLFDYNKKFAILGNINAITYKETFPKIKENRMWLGPSISSGDREFQVPDSYPLNAAGWRIGDDGKRYLRIKGVRWFTNLDHGRRHQPLPLMTMEENLKYSKHKEVKGKEAYGKYDNYDAIEVPFTDSIPSDYPGIMGVPISFLDKYNPDQFEILWQASGNTRASAPKEILEEIKYRIHPDDRGGCSVIQGRRTYGRVLIKKKGSV